MAKPEKAKKEQPADGPGKKSEKKAARPAAAGGFKGRLAKAQAARSSKGGKRAAKGGRSPMKFLREVKVEMSKVTWPSRTELVQSTIVVVIAVVIAGVFIFVFDQLFVRLVEWATDLFGGEQA